MTDAREFAGTGRREAVLRPPPVVHRQDEWKVCLLPAERGKNGAAVCQSKRGATPQFHSRPPNSRARSADAYENGRGVKQRSAYWVARFPRDRSRNAASARGLVASYRPASCAARAAALSARFLAKTRFFVRKAFSACVTNRFAVSYWVRASALSAR